MAAAGPAATPNCLTSPTTPTTTDGTARPKSGRDCDDRKIVSGLPTGSWSGQYRLATLSLITIPSPGVRISSAENHRPRTSGMRIVRRYASVTVTYVARSELCTGRPGTSILVGTPAAPSGRKLTTAASATPGSDRSRSTMRWYNASDAA